MKQLVCMLCVLGFVVVSFAQTPSLEISQQKTTSLVFPSPIIHIDRGTKDVLVQQVREVKNILLLKAAQSFFRETNVSVVTEDGLVYSFKVGYSSDPAQCVYHLPSSASAPLSTMSTSLLDNPPVSRGVKARKWEAEIRLIGIYIRENVLFYQLELKNSSPVNYDIDYLRFYIRDKKKSKRTAIQELEIKPLYIAGKTPVIRAADQKRIVVALEKHTLPDAKYLAVEMGEKNGGRHLQMKINNREIMKAIPLTN